jgi:hypothetical protein
MSRTSIALAALCSFTLALPSGAKIEPELTRDDFYLYCGYLTELENPKIAKIRSKKAQNKKIARRAKVGVKKLQAAVAKGEQVGATCDEIGKKYESEAMDALKSQKAFAGRVMMKQFYVDWSTPDHVVIGVTWNGGDKKKLVQEASLLASVLVEAAPIAKTIALRAVNPRAPDKTKDEAIWWEAKISSDRATRIDRERIEDFADRRYIRLFDGVKDLVAEK